MYAANRSFVIIGPARSGSTLLRMTLHGLPGLRCHGELFNPARVLGFENFAESKIVTKPMEDYRQVLLRMRKADPVSFVRDYALNGAGVDAVGFKLLQRHCILEQFRPVLDFLVGETALRVLFLWRESALRRYVSDEVLKNGGPATSLKAGRRRTPVTIRVDVDEFLLDVERQRELFEQLKRRFQTHETLQMTYESLCRDFRGGIRRATEFLGVKGPQGTVVPLITKVGTRELSEVIENFDEIRKDRRLSPYLD
jgi:LPS sulfotransferase NodH